jgi:hypothetical protein
MPMIGSSKADLHDSKGGAALLKVPAATGLS